MSNKPIEVGCKVLVIRSDSSTKNVGKIGTALNFEKTLYGWSGWVLESLGGNFMGQKYSVPKMVFKESHLIRLPDEGDVLSYDREQKLEAV